MDGPGSLGRPCLPSADMSIESRQRLARVVRDPDCDLAEAALLLCLEIEPEVDVDVELLRLDAIADGLRSQGFRAGESRRDAMALGAYLGDARGFTGDSDSYNDPRNGLLTRVLDRRRGLPITLSILYVAIGRRLHVPAFGIGLPGHFVTGIGGADRPVVIDPFDHGRLLDEAEMARRVSVATGGRLDFTRSLLRPAPAALVIRRVLNNLTRDFAAHGDAENALWTVELKHVLPSTVADDHRVRGELLVQLGSYRDAAEAFEAYLDAAGPFAADAEDVRRAAIRARAKLN